MVFQELPAKTERKALSRELEGGGIKNPQWAGGRVEQGELGRLFEERLRCGVNKVQKNKARVRSQQEHLAMWLRDSQWVRWPRFWKQSMLARHTKRVCTHGHHSSAEASGRTELQNWSGSYHLPLPE